MEREKCREVKQHFTEAKQKGKYGKYQVEARERAAQQHVMLHIIFHEGQFAAFCCYFPFFPLLLILMRVATKQFPCDSGEMMLILCEDPSGRQDELE